MSEQPDKQETAEFHQANHDLTRGLKLCHSLVDDYRMKLAAQPDIQAANDTGDDSPQVS